MRTTFAFLLLLAPSVSGCIPTRDEIRTQPTVRREFTSAKPAQLLAGCIAEGWLHDGVAGVDTTPRSDGGWSVAIAFNGHTFAVTDLTPAGKQTHIVFSTRFSTNVDKTVATIATCL